MIRPLPAEYPAYYKSYIDLVETDNVIKELSDQIIDVQKLISGVPEEKESFAYAPGKWTVKEVLGHIIDTERIMAYRALRFSRKDKTALSGFDEDKFVANANFNKRTLYDLAHEFGVVRESNIALFKHFDETALSELGNANGKEISVRSLLFVIAGHTTHHLNVIKKKYLADI